MRLIGHLGATGVPVYGVPRLTDRQREIVRAVDDYHAAHGRGPTLRELGPALGMPWQTVVYHLAALVARDVLVRDGRTPRSLRLA